MIVNYLNPQSVEAVLAEAKRKMKIHIQLGHSINQTLTPLWQVERSFVASLAQQLEDPVTVHHVECARLIDAVFKEIEWP